MKKLLTILILLLTVVMPTWADDPISLLKLLSVGSGDTSNTTYGWGLTTTGDWHGIGKNYGELPLNHSGGKKLVVESLEAGDLYLEVNFTKEGSEEASPKVSGTLSTVKRELSLGEYNTRTISEIAIKTSSALSSPITITKVYLADDNDNVINNIELSDFTLYYSASDASFGSSTSMKSTTGWTGGITYSPNATASTITVTTNEGAQLKVAAYYSDGWCSEYIDDTGGASSRVFKLDPNRTIGTIQLQSKENDQTVTFSEISLSSPASPSYTAQNAAKLDIKDNFTDGTYTVNQETESYKDLSANRLYVKFSTAVSAKFVVTYGTGESITTAEYYGSSSQEHSLILDNTKRISQIRITSGSVFTISEAYLDDNDGTLSAYALGENESELNPTSGTISQPVAWGNGLTFGAISGKVGDIITVYGTSESSHQIQFQTRETSWGIIEKNADGHFSSGKFVYTLTNSTASLLRDANLYITGNGYTPEHVTLTTIGDGTYAPISEVALTNFDDMDSKGSKQLYAGSSSTISAQNKQLVVTPTAAAKLKVAVYLVGVDDPITDEVTSEGTAKTEYSVSLGSEDKKIKKILITNNGTEAVTYSSISLEDDVASDPNVLWEGSLAISWTAVNMKGDANADKFEALAADSKIRISLMNTNTNYTSLQIWYKDATSNEDVELKEYAANKTIYDFVVTSDILANIKNGIYIKGDETITLTKIEKITDAGENFTPDDGETVLNYTQAVMEDGWAKSLYVGSSKFQGANAGDILKVYLANVGGGSISLSVGDNALSDDSKSGKSLENGATVYSLTLTATDVTALKAGTLRITGQGFTVTGVTLKSAEETTTIFDSEGNADLSKITVTNSEYVSYDSSTNTISSTKAWEGGVLTLGDEENVKNEQLVVTLVEAGAAYVVVSYKDESKSSTEKGTDNEANITLDLEDAYIKSITIKTKEDGTAESPKTIKLSSIVLQAKPVTTPIFDENGKADLSKVEKYGGEDTSYSYSTESGIGTITAPQWSGATLKMTDVTQQVSGTELIVTLDEAAKFGVYVYYADNTTSTEDAKADTESGTSVTVSLNKEKKIKEIIIKSHTEGSNTLKLKEILLKQEASVTKTEQTLLEKSVEIDSEGSTYVTIPKEKFENVADGDILKIYGTVSDQSQLALYYMADNWTYLSEDAIWSSFTTSPYSLTLTETTAGYLNSNGLAIKGKNFTFTKATLTSAGAVPTINYALTKSVSPVEKGSITVMQGETNVSETASFAEGTTLTLTATAVEGYVFLKWMSGETELEANTDKSLTVTMDADVTIEAVFKGSKLNNEERRTLWESSTGETLTWSDMMVQPAEVGEIVEAGEILIVTTSAVDTSEGHYPKIELRDKDGNSLASINPLVKGENRLSITSAMATKMAGGFKFQGESATLLKLELYKPTPITKLAEEDKKTLWENANGEVLSWNTISVDRAAEWGSVLEEDERFIISVKAKESGDNIWPTIQLQDLDGQKLASTATLLNDVKVPGDIVITLTAEMVEKLKNGFSITGDKATITKAVLYKPALPAKTVKILNDTETAITGDALVTVSAAKLANISAYDVLTVNFAINAETAKLVIKCNGEKDGWDYIKEMEFSGNETLFALPLTESAVALLKANGLGITGSGYTFKSVTIKTAGEVADDEKEEDDIANADATEATKKVFGILKDLYGKKIVSGVVANVDWNTKEAENVYGWTGKYPAINVYDFINLHASKDVNSEGWLDYSDISSAKNWWQEGGLVGAMWHWQVKANNGTDYTCTPGTAAGETSFDASKVYVEGTSENTLAKQQLDQLCGYLKKMQDAGIPVVWRPLHEASGNVEQYSGGKAWFWWGAKGADVYKQLWQWMYNYMVNTKGLNNLIWVWTSQTKDNNWYPGDAYVDIIGRDNYGATAASLAEEYEAQKVAYPNKMITLSECGNSETTEMAKLSSIWDAGSRWSWFMTWYDGDYNDGKTTTHKHTSEAWWKDAVAKDYVVTRDQMKELLNQGSSDNPSQTGVNISLDDLNEGWSSSYNAATKTITTEGEWAARGWYIGDDRYSQKGSITVKYEAVEFGVTLKMEYTNASGESKSVSAGAAAGETEVELDIPTDVKTIEKVYITYQPVGTLKLTAATVNDRIADNRTEKTLVESEAKIADGDIEINRGLFGNAAAKDVIRIYATGLSDASKIALELADYSGTLEGAGWVAFTESPFELKLTENMLSSIKEKGLLVRGEAFTFTKAALYTESDLGSVITDGGSDGDGGSDSGSSSQSQEKPIFNKKDGEADLSQMSAQDESTTTVTYSKRDNTITITTTEPYKAAQIWLNTPEEVTGNVLAVEIAEPGVDVTITVGYTDGSESSMSSRVAASTRAMTRGSAGTTIMVPLEVGKQVQKVEVKNANAGTITLNSMVMTNQDVFTNGKANLSMLKPQSGATYDISTYTLATTKGWTGVTVTPLETETVEGEELVVRFVDDAKVKVAVKYRSDEDGPSTIMEESANVVRLTLDRSKAVQEIMIQPTEAAILVFKEIAVNWERDTSGMLIEGKTLEVWSGGESLSWNEIAHQKKDISAQLQEFDQILVTVSGKAAGNDWPKVFLRDASSEMVGKEELLNEVTSFPCVVKFVLTKDMAERLKGGFSICGDGVTVTKVEIYRPFAPKKGDIHLRALDYGYGSEYDAATNTITTTQRWAARGWEIGDSRYNNKDLVIVEFEAVDFPVTLKMEYVDAYGEKQATSAGVAAGNTEVCLAIPSGIRQMDKAYIIYQNPGSLKLTNAEVITALQAGSRGISEDSRGISISSRSGYRPDGSKATAGDDAWYSLSGQRIEKPKAKGVYIHNGKTVVVH